MREPPIYWDRLLFCAKETAYKAWYSLTGRSLSAHDVSIELDRGRQTFRAHSEAAVVEADGVTPLSMSGKWLIDGGLIVTAIALSRSACT